MEVQLYVAGILEHHMYLRCRFDGFFPTVIFNTLPTTMNKNLKHDDRWEFCSSKSVQKEII